MKKIVLLLTLSIMTIGFGYAKTPSKAEVRMKEIVAKYKNVSGVDCTTVDIKLYKEALETKWVIGQNLKFDLQFLYNYGIIPRKVYDTMIVEQLLHLGYPSGVISYALNAIAETLGNVPMFLSAYPFLTSIDQISFLSLST